MAAPKRINLLVREGFAHTTPGKVLAWALSAGRTIVIITELVVIVAFLSRFWFDRQLTDLSDHNKVKKAQIEASLPFETDFRKTQKRLLAYKELVNHKTDGAGLIQSVAQTLPADTYLTEFYFNKEQLTLRGISLTEAGLSGFIRGLQSTDRFLVVTLDNLALESANRQSLSFTVVAKLK